MIHQHMTNMDKLDKPESGFGVTSRGPSGQRSIEHHQLNLSFPRMFCEGFPEVCVAPTCRGFGGGGGGSHLGEHDQIERLHSWELASHVVFKKFLQRDVLSWRRGEHLWSFMIIYDLWSFVYCWCWCFSIKSQDCKRFHERFAIFCN